MITCKWHIPSLFVHFLHVTLVGLICTDLFQTDLTLVNKSVWKMMTLNMVSHMVRSTLDELANWTRKSSISNIDYILIEIFRFAHTLNRKQRSFHFIYIKTINKFSFMKTIFVYFVCCGWAQLLGTMLALVDKCVWEMLALYMVANLAGPSCGVLAHRTRISSSLLFQDKLVEVFRIVNTFKTKIHIHLVFQFTFCGNDFCELSRLRLNQTLCHI